MYYIIETPEQLEKFCTYDLSECIVDVVPYNDHYHNAISPPSLVYIKPYRSKAGFILPLSHDESFKLDYDKVNNVIVNLIGQIYAIDLKRLKYYFHRSKAVFCLKTALYLNTGITLTEGDFGTSCHNFFYRKYYQKPDINKIIPISKHYEKLEKIVQSIPDMRRELESDEYYKFYCSRAINVFQFIEKQGVPIDSTVAKDSFNVRIPEFSILKDRIYSSYNFHTATGRPSNSFNGVNFAALNKEDGSRKMFVSSNDYFLEFDYSSYHLRLLCNLLDYRFEDSDIHTHLAKMYFKKDSITKEEYDESKGMTFRLLYTDTVLEDAKNNPFIKKVREYRNSLWSDYNKQGFILTPLAKKPITNIENKNQILPYLLQSYETELNISTLEKIFTYLCGKKTKVVLYCYDSILIDFAKEDGKDTLDTIMDILERRREYKVSIKYGKTYHKMKII